MELAIIFKESWKSCIYQ